jgi:rod shape-determining protein MreD
MILLVLIALVLQTSILLHLSIAGVTPDVMLLVAAAAGIAGGPDRGAVVGFASGLAIDLFLQTPLGLSALVFSLVGYFAGLLTTGILRASWWIPVLAVALASATGEVLFALAGAVVGQAYLVRPRLLVVAAVVAAVNAVLAPLVLRAVARALPGTGVAVA